MNMREMGQNEPLVPMSRTVNSLSVSSMVNTKAFRDAFEEMPLSRQVSNSLYRQAGRILRAANGTEFEYMVAVDARTGALVADNLGRRPEVGRTGFRGDEIASVMRRESGVVSIHNHPNSLPPSYRDLIALASFDILKSSVVVGHDGSVWFVSITNGMVAEILEARYNSLKDELAEYAEVKAVEWLLDRELLGKLSNIGGCTDA